MDTPDNDRIDRLIDWAEASDKAEGGEWSQGLWASQDICGTALLVRWQRKKVLNSFGTG